MTNHKEDLTELFKKWGVGTWAASKTADEVLAEYALIPRSDMPELDERGEASDEWWQETVDTEGATRRRRDAAYSLARAEWFEAHEAAEAETKLSVRRNNVLAEMRGRTKGSLIMRYEDLGTKTWAKTTVDMIIEAQDGADQ